MQHAVLLGRDIWMRDNDRSYRKLAPRPGDNCVMGDLTLSRSGLDEPYILLPILPPLPKLSICCMQVLPAHCFRAIINSSELRYSDAAVLWPSPAAN